MTEREAFESWIANYGWLPESYEGQGAWVGWQAALSSRKPLPSSPNVADSTWVEGYGWVPTAAVRAVEQAHGIGERRE